MPASVVQYLSVISNYVKVYVKHCLQQIKINPGGSYEKQWNPRCWLCLKYP